MNILKDNQILKYIQLEKLINVIENHVNKVFFSLSLFIATLFGGNNAAGQFSLTGELRPRTEYRHGLKTLASKDQASAFFTSQRTRLLLDYQGEKFNIGFNLQDIRVWGSTSQLNITDNFSSVHEAWGEI